MEIKGLYNKIHMHLWSHMTTTFFEYFAWKSDLINSYSVFSGVPSAPTAPLEISAVTPHSVTGMDSNFSVKIMFCFVQSSLALFIFIFCRAWKKTFLTNPFNGQHSVIFGSLKTEAKTKPNSLQKTKEFEGTFNQGKNFKQKKII